MRQPQPNTITRPHEKEKPMRMKRQQKTHLPASAINTLLGSNTIRKINKMEYLISSNSIAISSISMVLLLKIIAFLDFKITYSEVCQINLQSFLSFLFLASPFQHSKCTNKLCRVMIVISSQPITLHHNLNTVRQCKKRWFNVSSSSPTTKKQKKKRNLSLPPKFAFYMLEYNNFLNCVSTLHWGYEVEFLASQTSLLRVTFYSCRYDIVRI